MQFAQLKNSSRIIKNSVVIFVCLKYKLNKNLTSLQKHI
ncbi:hypothetical protein ND00_11460 [Clostridium sp. L74]|nr:hypothetical protein ND00_11460 [Clostridium sp. L74]